MTIDITARAPEIDPVIKTLEHMENQPSFGDIPIACTQPSKTNPRKIFATDKLDDLAASIKQLGVAQPILVRPIRTDGAGVTWFEIVAGERRWRASKLAGKTTVPAIVRKLTDIEALEIQVIENLQRQDLHPLEEAEGYEVLMEEAGYNGETMAEKVGKSKAYIYASLKLCALNEKVRKMFYDGLLTKSTALLVARIPIPAMQEAAAKEISTGYRGVMSARDAFQHIENNYMLKLKKAEFKPSDADLVPAAGACTTCPKRSGNQPEIYSDVNADVCTDPGCFKSKTAAHVIKIKQLATANGQTVISGAEAKKIMPHSYSSELGGGYVSLDSINYNDSKRRTYRQLIGKDAAQTVLLESPHAAEIKEIVKVADIKDLLKEKGVGISAGAGKANDSRDREKEQEAKAKVERAYRTELFTEIHHASLMMNLVDEDLRLLARIMYNNLPSNTIPTKLVMSLHGWTDDTFAYPDREGKLSTAINALSPAELNQLIRDCMLSHDMHVNVYTSYSEKDEPNRLLAMAARTKIDAKSIKKRFTDEAKAKADAKKKAAAQKAAKVTGAKLPAPAAATSTPALSAPAKATPSTKPKAPAKPAPKVKPKAAATKAAETKPATSPAKPAVTPPAAEPTTATPAPNVPAAAWPFPTSSQPKF